MERHIRHEDDEGSVILIVLIIAVLLIGAMSAALAASVASLNMSSQYKTSNQASLAAQSGIAVELAKMRNLTVYYSLPCTTTTGTFSAAGGSAYSVTVTYLASGTALTCAGSSGATLGTQTNVPTSAIIRSKGTSPHAPSVTMRADVAIAAGSGVSLADNYAVFTENNLNLNQAATVTNGPSGAPNMYVGQAVTCSNGTLSTGALTTYQPISMSNSCTVQGELQAQGSISLANTATIGGDAWAYGGAITMTGNTNIAGNAYATGGNISLGSGNPVITGNADASGSISGSTIKGTSTANDATLASKTMPSSIYFPTIDPAAEESDLQAEGWSTINVPSATYPSCASFFANPTSGNDSFMSSIQAATNNTVIYAPTCAVSYNHVVTFQFNADFVLEVQSFTTQNTTVFESTNGTARNVSILASADATCSNTVDVSFSNLTNFVAPATGSNPNGVNMFIYTEGAVSYANNPTMTGQIMACGNITGSNAFSMTYSNTASKELIGIGQAGSPTITPEDKYVCAYVRNACSTN